MTGIESDTSKGMSRRACVVGLRGCAVGLALMLGACASGPGAPSQDQLQAEREAAMRAMGTAGSEAANAHKYDQANHAVGSSCEREPSN